MLLSADFQTDHLNQTAFKRRVQIFDTGVLLKVRSNRVGFNFACCFQNSLANFLGNDALLFKHEHVSTVNRQIREVGRFIVALSDRVINIFDHFRSNRLADTTAVIVFGHLIFLLRTSRRLRDRPQPLRSLLP